MKLRDSGMPEEAHWEKLLRPAEILDRLGIDHVAGDAAEFGCGYGTFTLPLAERVRGTVWAYDIEPAAVERVAARVRQARLTNVRPLLRDLSETGTGLPAASVHLVVIINLLHGEEPERLLAEARRIVAPAGALVVGHWIHDANTPRGPDLAIRPRPEVLCAWCQAAGFVPTTAEAVPLPPYHYGWRLHPV